MVIENCTKDSKESVYHGAVMSALAVRLNNTWKILNKNQPPSLRKFDVQDGVKLVAIFDFTKYYLIKE